jgi:hypothetical protein
MTSEKGDPKQANCTRVQFNTRANNTVTTTFLSSNQSTRSAHRRKTSGGSAGFDSVLLQQGLQSQRSADRNRPVSPTADSCLRRTTQTTAKSTASARSRRSSTSVLPAVDVKERSRAVLYRQHLSEQRHCRRLSGDLKGSIRRPAPHPLRFPTSPVSLVQSPPRLNFPESSYSSPAQQASSRSPLSTRSFSFSCKSSSGRTDVVSSTIVLARTPSLMGPSRARPSQGNKSKYFDGVCGSR